MAELLILAFAVRYLRFKSMKGDTLFMNIHNMLVLGVMIA